MLPKYLMVTVLFPFHSLPNDRNRAVCAHQSDNYQINVVRFNAMTLLEKLRGKRVIFVGDSLNTNQWTSLLCLIESSIPPSERFTVWNGSLATFKTTFYWEPLLVESNYDDPAEHHIRERVVNVKKIDKHAMHWKDEDLLIFDSFIWWLSPNLIVFWGSSEDSVEQIQKELEKAQIYKMALKTWTNWLNLHINHNRMQMFFMSFSPHHHG